MKYRIIPAAADKTAKSIFITGGTRTGTSMMARMLYSLDHVEGFHEPAFLYAYFYMIEEMDEATWKLLLESFVFEELLLSALAGRRLNFNEHDESSVFHSKTREEIAERLSRTHRHHDLVPRSRDYRIASRCLKPCRCWNGCAAIIRHDVPGDVAASRNRDRLLIQRGWYSDAQMRNPGGEWVFRDKSPDGLRIAPWGAGLPDR